MYTKKMIEATRQYFDLQNKMLASGNEAFSKLTQLKTDSVTSHTAAQKKVAGVFLTSKDPIEMSTAHHDFVKTVNKNVTDFTTSVNATGVSLVYDSINAIREYQDGVMQQSLAAMSESGTLVSDTMKDYAWGFVNKITK